MKNYHIIIIGIDECSTVADCVRGTVCINTAKDPGYLCQCPPGFTGDGRINGDGCIGEIYNLEYHADAWRVKGERE